MWWFSCPVFQKSAFLFIVFEHFSALTLILRFSLTFLFPSRFLNRHKSNRLDAWLHEPALWFVSSYLKVKVADEFS